ncbi:NADH dehydrogenase [ubiquinone] 1 alpha subcomplex assembly factor 2 isoform X2 [Oryctolagus cuniculus]|uniref:NADH dehydrogenase [ubiquinone] 1 alpha subcomplex assembly factor 2 isoform X2 n=1 Tax=Oryctolagus cuniculus TaxID=9986 RepID=UPI002230FF46|nr:NADH dehydrogenase [ubiquinone] 1 alpha subcomplex assembly factor 2 isoform X7 [Oryctolagus cuniculus]
MGSLRRVFRVLWSSLSKEVREHVGTDQHGNKYYYVPEYKNWRGQTIREKRIVEAADKKEVDYEVGDIPTEWEAWIRRTRKTPPTVEKCRERDKQENSFICCFTPSEPAIARAGPGQSQEPRNSIPVFQLEPSSSTSQDALLPEAGSETT